MKGTEKNEKVRDEIKQTSLTCHSSPYLLSCIVYFPPILLPSFSILYASVRDSELPKVMKIRAL